MVLHAVPVFAAAVKVFGGDAATRGEVIKDISEDILTVTILVAREIAVLLLDMRFGITSRYEKTLRQDIDARRAVPAPHRHGLHLGRILRIGGEVVAQSRQVLNVVGNALAD